MWPDEWRIFVACILLNCATRRTAERVIPRLFDAYPTPAAMANANPSELSDIIASLGFKNRRTKTLIDMSREYCRDVWRHPEELPGIGKYAADAWEIFIRGVLPEHVPNDGALKNYYMWRKRHGL